MFVPNARTLLFKSNGHLPSLWLIVGFIWSGYLESTHATRLIDAFMLSQYHILRHPCPAFCLSLQILDRMILDRQCSG